MEKVLVTGGAGYIGSVLVPFLLRSRYKVRVLDLFTAEYPSLISCVDYEGFEAVKGDCRSLKVLEECLEGIDFVIPLAGIVGAPACDKNGPEAWSTNYQAIMTLCGLVFDRNIRILFPNTNSGYGTTPSGSISDEDTPLSPISQYAKMKQAAEKALFWSPIREKSIVFRLATAFGPSPRMRLDLLVNDLTYRAVRDKSVILYEPHFRRNFIHVHDIGRLFLFGMQNFDKLKGRPWNAGLHYGLTKRELCETIKKIIPSFQFSESDIGVDPDKRDYNVSTKRLEAEGFKCSVSLERGIRELVKTYTMFPHERFRNA